MQKKSLKLWAILAIAPWAILIFNLFFAFGMKFVASTTPAGCTTSMVNSSASASDGLSPGPGLTVNATNIPDSYCKPNSTKAIGNVISILLGVVGVLGIMISPLWVILLIVASDHNKKLAGATQATVPMPQPDPASPPPGAMPPTNYPPTA